MRRRTVRYSGHMPDDDSGGERSALLLELSRAFSELTDLDELLCDRGPLPVEEAIGYVLQALDYLANIDIYHERIKMFHVKDAELNPTGRQGVYGGYQSWIDRAGRFRSLGDGHVDFSGIFSKFAQYDFDGWAVLEWECCLKHPEDGAREGAEFIESQIIRVTERAFDDFAGAETDAEANKAILGLS